MYKNLILIITLNFLFASTLFCGYLTYDGKSIYFGNESQISVFTCSDSHCYDGFTTVGIGDNQFSMHIQPLNDEIVNMSVAYNLTSTDFCILRFGSNEPFEIASTSDGSIFVFFNQNVSFGLIPVEQSSTQNKNLIIDDGQVCIKAFEKIGYFKMILVPPAWLEKNIQILKVSSNVSNSSIEQSEVESQHTEQISVYTKINDTTESISALNTSNSSLNDTKFFEKNTTDTILSNNSKLTKSKTIESDNSFKYEYIALGSFVVFLIVCGYVLFFSSRKSKFSTTSDSGNSINSVFDIKSVNTQSSVIQKSNSEIDEIVSSLNIDSKESIKSNAPSVITKCDRDTLKPLEESSKIITEEVNSKKVNKNEKSNSTSNSTISNSDISHSMHDGKNLIANSNSVTLQSDNSSNQNILSDKATESKDNLVNEILPKKSSQDSDTTFDSVKKTRSDSEERKLKEAEKIIHDMLGENESE